MRKHQFGAALCAALLFALSSMAQETQGADTFQAQVKLCEAITGGDANAVAAALDAGAKLAQPCPKEMIPPLHQAIESGKVEIVTLLLDRGADVNQPDNGVSATPLHYAAAKEDPALVALLLKRGAKVDALTDEGVSVLGIAVLRHDNPDVVQALIDAGADVNAVDEQGDTLLDTALAMGKSKIAALLESKGAKPGEEPGIPAEDMETPEPVTAVAPPEGKRTDDGQLVFKGFYLGMPLPELLARMTAFGFSAGEFVGGDMEGYGRKFVESQLPKKGSIGRGFSWSADLDDAERVKRFTLYWGFLADKDVFNCADMDVRQFATAFRDAYAIPSMEPVKRHNWGFEYTDPAGWKVRIDENRMLVLERVPAAAQRAFD